MITNEQALEAIENMDDYARMGVSVDPIGPRETLIEFVQQTIQLRVENTRLKVLVSKHQAAATPGNRRQYKLISENERLKAELAEVKKEAEKTAIALICMTGWTKEYALEKGWNRNNASLIWAGIDSANAAIDAAMKGK